MTLALYRRYRPGSFTELIGQEHVTQPLRRSLESGNVHHAFLFSGPRGCGKTSSARILARSLNCESGPTANPCGTCQSCIDLAPNGPGSVDVIEIDAATHGKVDNARELRESAAFVPVNSRFKVYIIDEAHELSSDAQNALLKLVEEPPEHLKFVFATTQPEKIPATIKSRTHHYPFRLVTNDVLAAHLATISNEESINFEPAALTLIATGADGSVRDSLSLLSQLASGVGDGGLTTIYVASQLGLTPANLIEKTLDALAADDGAALFSVIDDVVAAGIEPRRFAIDLLNCLRDLLLIATLPAASTGHDAQSLSIMDSGVLISLAKKFNSKDLGNMANEVAAGIADLRGVIAPRLQLELLAAKLLMLVSQPIKSDEEEPAKSAPNVPRLKATAPTKTSAATTAEKPSAKAKPNALDLSVVRAHWPAIIEGLMNRRATWMIFTHAQPKSVTGSVISVGLPDLGRTTAAQKPPHIDVLTETMSMVLEQPVTVEFVHDPSMGVFNNETKKSPKQTRENAVNDHDSAEESSSQVDSTQIEEASSDEVVGLKLVEQTLGATRIAEYEDT